MHITITDSNTNANSKNAKMQRNCKNHKHYNHIVQIFIQIDFEHLYQPNAQE